jgi:hypothetical protein
MTYMLKWRKSEMVLIPSTIRLLELIIWKIR